MGVAEERKAAAEQKAAEKAELTERAQRMKYAGHTNAYIAKTLEISESSVRKLTPKSE